MADTPKVRDFFGNTLKKLPSNASRPNRPDKYWLFYNYVLPTDRLRPRSQNLRVRTAQTLFLRVIKRLLARQVMAHSLLFISYVGRDLIE